MHFPLLRGRWAKSHILAEGHLTVLLDGAVASDVTQEGFQKPNVYSSVYLLLRWIEMCFITHNNEQIVILLKHVKHCFIKCEALLVVITI